MNALNSSEEKYTPAAIYYGDSDCVEYVRGDGLLIYERIDPFLTLVHDATGDNLIGFKLKGFRHLVSRVTAVRLTDKQFLALASALEAIVTDLGDEIFADTRRHYAYSRAYQLAANDNVALMGDGIPLAA